MQAEETWRKIGLVAFHKVTGRPWRISRHFGWFTHTPACSPIPHKRFSSVSHFPRCASCIPCFGSCPRSVHDHPLQRLKHSGHFVPSKYTVCNLIFHKVGSLFFLNNPICVLLCICRQEADSSAVTSSIPYFGKKAITICLRFPPGFLKNGEMKWGGQRDFVSAADAHNLISTDDQGEDAGGNVADGHDDPDA